MRAQGNCCNLCPCSIIASQVKSWLDSPEIDEATALQTAIKIQTELAGLLLVARVIESCIDEKSVCLQILQVSSLFPRKVAIAESAPGVQKSWLETIFCGYHFRKRLKLWFRCL